MYQWQIQDICLGDHGRNKALQAPEGVWYGEVHSFFTPPPRKFLEFLIWERDIGGF